MGSESASETSSAGSVGCDVVIVCLGAVEGSVETMLLNRLFRSLIWVCVWEAKS